MTAMVMLRLGLGLVNRLGGIGAAGSARRLGTITFDRAAQEAVDERSGLLRAARKGFGKAAWALAVLASIAFALLAFRLAGVALTRVGFAGAVVPILVTEPSQLVAVCLDPAETFKRGCFLARS